jgi:hypothetical protein
MIGSGPSFGAWPSRWDGRDAFGRVARRRRRLRRLRTAKIAAVAAVLAVGTTAAGIGLRALLAGPEPVRFGDPRPSPTPSAAPSPSRLCGVSSAVADLDGDGADDRIRVGVPLPGSATDCRKVPLDHYVARVRLAVEEPGAPAREQSLTECAVPGQCWVLGARDLDRDGRAEVAINVVIGVSTLNLSLYRVDVAAPDGPLHLLEVAAPGDPFDDLFGIAPGSSTFPWYGSVTHQHWISCEERPGEFAVVTALRDERDPDLQNLHATVLRIEGDELVVVTARDEVVPDGSVGVPPDLCGAPLGQRP